MEIHEQPWCPPDVRDGATDCLRLIAVIGRQFEGALPSLRRALSNAGARRIVDLGSGGGGPWLALHKKILAEDGTPVAITLTDLYPNRFALRAASARAPGQIDFVEDSVDATRVPRDLRGLRTLFTTFHHFDPVVARAILQDAVSSRQGIAIFEQTRRSWAAQLFMLILVPIAFLAVPLLRPFRWSRLFWTYVIPAIPAVLLFDAIVSCWRTYTEEELRDMVDSLVIAPCDQAPYTWETGRVRTLMSPLGISYLIGYPAVDDSR